MPAGCTAKQMAVTSGCRLNSFALVLPLTLADIVPGAHTCADATGARVSSIAHMRHSLLQ